MKSGMCGLREVTENVHIFALIQEHVRPVSILYFYPILQKGDVIISPGQYWRKRKLFLWAVSRYTVENINICNSSIDYSPWPRIWGGQYYRSEDLLCFSKNVTSMYIDSHIMDDMTKFPNIERLTVTEKMTGEHELAKFSKVCHECHRWEKLTTLVVWTQLPYRHFSSVAQLKTLCVLKLVDQDLFSLEPLKSLPLEHLELYDFGYLLKELSGIETCPIRHLAVSHCEGLEDVSAIDSLKGIEYLVITRCHNVQTMNLPTIAKHIDLEGMGFREITTGGSISATFLDMSLCYRLTSMDFLRHCTSLTSLNISEMQIKDISPLATLRNLRVLNLSCCCDIEDISPITHLSTIEELIIGCGVTCVNIPEIDYTPLVLLPKLRMLSVCKHIKLESTTFSPEVDIRKTRCSFLVDGYASDNSFVEIQPPNNSDLI